VDGKPRKPAHLVFVKEKLFLENIKISILAFNKGFKSKTPFRQVWEMGWG
jgi:hypothetical protein